MRSINVPGRIPAGAAFHVVNLGCKVNRVESDSIAASLSARGCHEVPLAQAQVVVVNTCTVTGEAEKKARKAVRHALSAAEKAQVIVTGCAVAIDTETYASLSERVTVVNRAALLSSLCADGAAAPLRIGGGFHTRVPIKVQDGCNRACTYCIVHVARGPATSTPCNQVVDEARRYLEAGVKELVLTGIDLGSYRDGDTGLDSLVSTLLQLTEATARRGERPGRIRASSLEPHSISPLFIDLLASSEGRLCRHLHLPLQSGSTKVLSEMGRPYTAEGYLRLVERLYERIPSLSLTTDIICGFPGETDDDFLQTVDLARACKFSKIHVFPYSRREGTPAAARNDQVSPELKAKRAANMRFLSDELRRADLHKRKGARELAIVEDDCLLTESYHELPKGSEYDEGSLVEICL